MLKLYYSPNSPLSRKVRVVLHETGLEFEGDAQSEHRDPDSFKAVNPILRVPVIEDGSHRLFESDLIIDYILATYPSKQPNTTQRVPLADGLYRDGPEQWADKETLAILNAFGDSVANLLFLEREGVKRTEVPYLQRQATRIQSCLDWLEERATPEGFLPGVLSVQDISLISWWEWLNIRGVTDLGELPKLAALVAYHADRPSFIETRPS